MYKINTNKQKQNLKYSHVRFESRKETHRNTTQNKIKGKGQASIEYLMIIGLAMLLILPGIYLFLSSSQETKLNAVGQQIYKAGTEIMKRSTELYVLGDESFLTLELVIPEEITEVNLSNSGKELIFKYGTNEGISEIVMFTDGYAFRAGPDRANLCENCTLIMPRGKANLRMQSLGDGTIWLKIRHN